jgi:hypothetical protein
MIRILAVHGVGNLRPGHAPETVAEALARSWHRYLAHGPLGTLGVAYDVRAAYYAPHLCRVGQQAGPAMLEDLDDAAQEMVIAWAEAHGMSTAGAQGRTTAPVRSAVSWVAQRRGLPEAAVEAFVAVFFREVATYLGGLDSPQRHAARETVARAIELHTPDVVLAHSLGSVVAYEALHSHPDHPISLWLTVGSPLALPGAVYQRLDLSNRAHHGRPPGVSRWANLADPGDLVALPRRGLPRSFTDVDADVEASIHWLDFHTAANYLASDALAALLRQYAADAH